MDRVLWTQEEEDLLTSYLFQSLVLEDIRISGEYRLQQSGHVTLNLIATGLVLELTERK